MASQIVVKAYSHMPRVQETGSLLPQRFAAADPWLSLEVLMSRERVSRVVRQKCTYCGKWVKVVTRHSLLLHVVGCPAFVGKWIADVDTKRSNC